ncbi:leucine-rich repeat-containing protein 45-like isoform X2 [Nylanderia fulva]|uniref:leucine-rich repeat-containing protein 45-like isoform X2 n=1 Tax=Nylanderia fulva TaxID=613905 RepID=UPI0010FB4D3E|nr:leucine-rich repeat-containing protein 45-like isoform X2 [Nylanderia fulva]
MYIYIYIYVYTYTYILFSHATLTITGELQLSCLSIIIPVCKIIAQTLISSSTIKTLDISDCVLLPKGLDSILKAFCEGTAVTILKLKGNNVNGSSVAQLGRVLAYNNTLKQLHIEWNSVGSHIDSFAAFCDGLTRNHNIEQLDLRYNQISPHCAEHLCKMIYRNKVLKSIDLSWNTLGLQGGRLLLKAVCENKIMTNLFLHGNCIPEDIILAIEKQLQENRHRYFKVALSVDAKFTKFWTLMENGFTMSTTTSDLEATCSKQKHLTPRRKEKTKTEILQASTDVEINNRINPSEINSVINTELKGNNESSNARVNISLRDQDNNRTTETDAKIVDLGKKLQERTTVIDLLTGELTTKIAEMDDMRTQLCLLQTEINQLQEEKEKFDSDKAREIAELQKSLHEAEKNWQKSYKDLKNDYNECSQKKKEADSKIRQYEKEIHKSLLEIGLRRDKLVSTTRAYEDLLSKKKIEMHRLKREFKERDNKHKVELNILKNTLKEITQAFKVCQIKLHKSRNESHDLYEKQDLLKIKLNDAEHKMLRYTRLEENYQKIEEEKNTLEEKLTDSQRTVSLLQRQVTSFQSELIEPQKHYKLLKDELDQEKRISEKLKQELFEERAKLKDQNLQMEKMNQQITELNIRLNKVQIIHSELLCDRDRERKQLQDIISSKEHNLTELRNGEIERAGQLYAAFNKYLSSIGPIL